MAWLDFNSDFWRYVLLPGVNLRNRIRAHTINIVELHDSAVSRVVNVLVDDVSDPAV